MPRFIMIQLYNFSKYQSLWSSGHTMSTAAPGSGGALSVALGVENLDSAHRTDPLLVGALLAVVGANLVNFLLK